MGYVKNTWVDQNVERPKTYEVTNNQDGSITLTDSFGLVTELGTPVNATNMNHIENGLALSDLMKYSADVTYSAGEWVTGEVNNEKGIYESLADNNINNALSDTTKWEKIPFGLSPATTLTLGGVIVGEGIDVQEDGTISIVPQANQSLSNLTDEGNAKFQYTAFTINNGTADANGDNATLHVPAGSQTEIEVLWDRPNLTANGTMGGPDFAVYASNEYYVSPNYYPAWKAVDGTTTGVDYWASTVLPVTFDFYNPTALKVSKLRITNGTYQGRAIASGEVYASDDNNTWTLLTTFTNTAIGASDVWDIDLSSNTNSYKYYRIKSLTHGGNMSAIADLSIFVKETISTGTTVICDSCTITTADSQSKSFDYESILDCSLLADGDYLVYKSFENGALTVGTSLTKAKIAPTSPSANDLWLDISEYPYCLKKYASGSWSENNDLVHIGNITVSSGNVIFVENVPFRGDNGYYVETYSNGNSWYRIFPDGFCIQGSLYYKGSTIAGDNTITFLKEFVNTNYTLTAMPIHNATSLTCYAFVEKYVSRTTQQAVVYTISACFGYQWVAYGYVK